METSERLLKAWLKLTANVRGNRILRELSLNEIMILRLIHTEGGDAGLTAKAITERMKLMKSQIHKVLAALESRGMISRRRCERDERSVNIMITEAGIAAYTREHGRIIELVDGVARRLGEENCETLTYLVDMALEATSEAKKELNWAE